MMDAYDTTTDDPPGLEGHRNNVLFPELTTINVVGFIRAWYYIIMVCPVPRLWCLYRLAIRMRSIGEASIRRVMGYLPISAAWRFRYREPSRERANRPIPELHGASNKTSVFTIHISLISTPTTVWSRRYILTSSCSTFN